MVVDARTGRVLWGRGQELSRPIASTTKILTALVARKAGDLDKVVSVDATPPVADGIGLAPGDHFTRRQLLWAMMLKSANDAAYVLAEDVAGSQEEFVARMNAEARLQSAGKGVTLANVHGLPNPKHKATATAVCAWTRSLLDDPELSYIVRTKYYRLGRFGTVANTDQLLWWDKRVVGVKTGYTDAAGYCLSSALVSPEATLVAVVLGAPTDTERFRQSYTLLKWGLTRYRAQRVVRSRQPVGSIPVPEWDELLLTVRARSDATATVLLDAPLSRRVVVQPALATPITTGQVVGAITITQEGRTLATVDVVVDRSVPTPTFWDRVRLWWRRLWGAGAKVGA
jgi:D-alanyl-D-alanine carboxypeptidase (penicillin-binding protein 5/6)